MKENLALLNELQQMLRDYFSQNEDESIYSLSKNCGVASSTLRRILNGEVTTGPQGSTVLGIVSAIAGERNIQKLIQRFDGEVGQKLKRCYQNVLETTEYAPELASILSDRLAYVVFKLASNTTGTTDEKVVKLMGIPALETIKELVELGLLFRDNNKIYANRNSFALPETLIKKHLPEMVRFSNFGSEYVDKSCFYSFSESINSKAYHEIRTILVRACKEIREVVKEKESLGEIPFFLTSILDTMEVPTDNS